MRYPASEKLEIIRTVEASHLPTRQTLKMLGIPSSTYYDWYARWSDGGIDALADRSPRPGSVWNRIPDKVCGDVVDFALEHEDLTSRELAVKYTDEKRYFVSESSVYRILSAEDLITAPAHVVIRAADEFRDKTTRPNELWQTDFTYLKVVGWGWFYLSTILDDYSRYIIAWKLCTTMKAEDVTDTLELALGASGCDSAAVVQKPRLLGDNGSSYVAADLAEYLCAKGMLHVRGAPHHPQTQGKIERWHQTMKKPGAAGELLPARRPGTADRCLRRSLQQPPLPREPGQPNARRRLPRSRREDPEDERGDQEADNPKPPVAAPSRCHLNSNRNRTRASVTKQP